jgi:hypothetical protein
VDVAKLLKLAVKRGVLADREAAALTARFKDEKKPEKALREAGAIPEEKLRQLLREMRSGIKTGEQRAFERYEDQLLARALTEARLAPKTKIYDALVESDRAQNGGEDTRLADALVAAGLVDEEAAEVAVEQFHATVGICTACFARTKVVAKARCPSCGAPIGRSARPAKKPSERTAGEKRRGNRARKKLAKESARAAALVVQSTEEPIPAPDRKPIIIMGAVAAALVLAVGIFLGTRAGPEPRPPETAPPPPPPPPTAPVEAPLPPPPPKPADAPKPPARRLGNVVDEAVAKAKPLMDAGRYADARAILKPLTQDPDPDVVQAVAPVLEQLDKLEKLGREAGDRLSALDASPDGPHHEEALVALAAWWRKHIDDRGLAPMVRVTARLTDERKARFAANKARGTERLAKAKAALAEGGPKPAAADDASDWPARLALAKAATTKKPLTVDVTDAAGKKATWKALIVTKLDASGFTIESSSRKLTAKWVDRPDLAVEILGLSRHLEGADRIADLTVDARIAWDLGNGEAARALWEERARLVPGAAVPDLAAISAAKPYQAKVDEIEKGARLRLGFGFDREEQLADWRGAEQITKLRAAGGGVLEVMFKYAELKRPFELDAGPVDVDAELDARGSSPFVGFDLEADDRSRTIVDVSWQNFEKVYVATLHLDPPREEDPKLAGLRNLVQPKWETLGELPLGRKLGAQGFDPIRITLHAKPGSAPEVLVNGKPVALAKAPVVGSVVRATPRLGALVGGGSFRNVTFVAPARRGWLRKLDEEYQRVLKTELAKGHGGGPKAKARLDAARSSADDPLELAGIPEVALDALRRGREAAEKGDDKGARAAFDLAASAAAPFPAALLERARLEAQKNIYNALDDLEQVLVCMESCPEALGQKAVLEIVLGDTERGTADLNAALEARPDLSLAYKARGAAAFARRRPEVAGDASDAAADLELASALAPEDVQLAKDARAARKLVEGPWPGKKTTRRTTDHYVILTDVDAKTLEAVTKTIEDAWKTFAAEFPTEGDWRRAELVVFDTRSDFIDWADVLSFPMGPTSSGFFNPFYDQLVLYENELDRKLEDTRETTVHEGFHQYAHRVLPPLPNWLDEGLAMTFGNATRKDGGVDPNADAIRKCLGEGALVLRDRRGAQREWRAFINASYEEFHDLAHAEANRRMNYARAWITASILREKSGPLRKVLPYMLAHLRKERPEKVLADAFSDEAIDALDRAFRAKAQGLLGR